MFDEKKGILQFVCVIITIVICVMLFYNNINYKTAKTQSLSWGSQGDQVTTLQTKLKQWGYYDGPISGIFGAQTFEAVKSFQRRNGLAVDGVVGTQTLAALGMSIGTPTTYKSTEGATRTPELNLMARAIHGEARGEPYVGKVAVGAVILNRVRSSKFPNSISGVIYQPGAFTAVADGQINLAPEEESFRAARDAMNGWDPSGGAIYYYNPAKTTNKWIWSRPVHTVIGKHRFAT